MVYVKTALPVYAVFLLIDRLYQYYRFGSFFNTYVHYFSGRTPPSGSFVAGELSVRESVPRRLSGRALCAGEVHLSF